MFQYFRKERQTGQTEEQIGLTVHLSKKLIFTDKQTPNHADRQTLAAVALENFSQKVIWHLQQMLLFCSSYWIVDLKILIRFKNRKS